MPVKSNICFLKRKIDKYNHCFIQLEFYFTMLLYRFLNMHLLRKKHSVSNYQSL